jgi:hypothetical protein
MQSPIRELQAMSLLRVHELLLGRSLLACLVVRGRRPQAVALMLN